MKRLFGKIFAIIVITIFVVNTNFALAVSQSDINAKQSEIDSNNAKKKEIEDKKEEVEEIKDATLKEVEKLNSQISDYNGQISTLNSQISEANKKIADSQAKLEQAEKDYKEQQEKFQNRLVAVYEAGETSYLDVLLSSESVADFISNYYLVTEVAEFDTEMMNTIEKKKEEISDTKKELETSKQTLETSKKSLESVKSNLSSAKSEKDAKVSNLSAEEQKLQKQIDELERDNSQINKLIQSMQEEIRRAQAKYQQSNSGTSAAGFIRPVNSYVTTGMYYSSGSYHGAVDFGASSVNGMPVYAAQDGIVVLTQRLTTSYGNYIILYHPNCNLYTLYAHGQAGSIRVSAGQYVKQGQQIMNVGSTGNSTGPHLHFEVRTSPGYYSNRVNPLNYLP